MPEFVAICPLGVVFLLLVFWSFRYGSVTMVPVGLVTIWLLGTMHLLGIGFNIVTILIGAISIGVGIDYSIHITHRYREERRAGRVKDEAVRNTLTSTGLALFSSAMTTMLGFVVLMFASFKVFVAFGVLTMVMILFSLVAAVVVLPTLLLLVDREEVAKEDGNSEQIKEVR